MEEWVDFQGKGGKLVGILAAPDGQAAPLDCVVFIHGWTGYRIGPHRIIVKIARDLAANGVASLRFDLRGRGDSQGDPDATTLDDMIADTCVAVDVVSRRFPASRLTLWGICSGGNVAIGTATLRNQAHKLVLLSTLPFIPQKKTGEKLARTTSYAGGYLRKALRPATWKKLFKGAVDFGSIRKVLFGHYRPAGGERDKKDSARDVMADFRHYRGDALFIYGGADPEAVDARAHYEAFTREAGIPSRTVVIEGSNHDFYSLAWEDQIAGLTRDWIRAAGRAET